MIIINGAGIAGLTLANALLLKKLDFVLIEKAKQLSSIGAGLLLQNNGLAILDTLGLKQYISGFDVTQMSMGFNNQINSVNVRQTGLLNKVVHRAHLQSVLLKNIDSNKIKLGLTITHKEVHEQSVTVTLSDGQIIKGDYLIDAGGIHSNLVSEAQLFDTRLCCWRTIVPLKNPINISGEYWFGKQRLGITPISDTQAYVYHVIKLNKNENPEDYSFERRQTWIKNKQTSIKDIKQLSFDNTQWLSHPLQDRNIQWGQGRVIAIGDAAHAMTPNLGQGAVLSMEDAMQLALILSNTNSTCDVATLLKFHRHQRIKKTHKLSRVFGNIAHNENGFFNFIKRIVFKIIPMNLALKNQVKWMNEFNITLERFKK
ncbi:MAG: FAD-dependent monooxygenase [Saccharospirillaceae bacterium]|nr:FAD-dependent monooxygenase [Pseudomonadales bacterium]NRB77806.1 FAD-dependent monooxygenase [Saccharospirillaceae bacterium]